VPHTRLVHKVKAHGIGGSVLAWIENRLPHRKQRVGKLKEWENLTIGVPWGSVLGLQLFTVYINDLEEGT